MWSRASCPQAGKIGAPKYGLPDAEAAVLMTHAEEGPTGSYLEQANHQRRAKVNAFITGSHAYGKPTSRSDVDLVVRVSEANAAKLRKLAGVKEGQPIMFGKLNLVVCTDDTDFAIWKLGTNILREKEVPTGRLDAKEVFDELRGLLNVKDNYE